MTDLRFGMTLFVAVTEFATSVANRSKSVISSAAKFVREADKLAESRNLLFCRSPNSRFLDCVPPSAKRMTDLRSE
jgi:hypothetical protein